MNISQTSRRWTVVLGLIVACSLGSPALADMPGSHPGYLHGMADLRMAHKYLAHMGQLNVLTQESGALAEVHRAYEDARHAASYDGKNLNDQSDVDANLNHGTRLQKAYMALLAAKRDFSSYESSAADRGWQQSALKHINLALKDTARALHDEHRDRMHKH